MLKGVTIIIFTLDPLGYMSLETHKYFKTFFLRDIISSEIFFFISDFRANRVHTVKWASENALNPTYNQKSPCESAKPPNRHDIFELQKKNPSTAVIKNTICIASTSESLRVTVIFLFSCFSFEPIRCSIFYSFKGKQHLKVLIVKRLPN